MYKTAGTICVFKHIIIRKRKRKQIPKSVAALFLVSNLCFGIDFGFVKLVSSNYRRFAKCISILTSVVTFIILLPPINNPDRAILASWYWVVLAQYAVYFLILHSAKYSVYDFMADIHRINEEDNVTAVNKQRLGVAASIYAFVVIFAKLSLFIAFCLDNSYVVSCDSYFAPFYIYCVLNQSIDVIPITQTLLYYYIYCCVKYLNESINSTEISIIQKQYMKLADCFDTIKPLHDKLLMALLLFEVPKIMSSLTNMVFFLKTNGGWIGFTSELTYCIPIFIHICAPAVIAEMVGSQLDDIKLKLHSVLIAEADENKIFEMNRMLGYMEVHNLEHKACGIVPVDIRLPFSLLTLCANYLIGVLQLGPLKKNL